VNSAEAMDRIFNPASVAVVGASPGKSGQEFLEGLIGYGFEGRIYPINSRGEEVCGQPAYSDIKDVPGPIDYVVCCAPAPAVPGLIRDCAAKGVRAIGLFTAGFSESGSEEGSRLEAEIAHLARSVGVRLIGPNCLGIYNPKLRLTFGYPHPQGVGRVAFMCQSGGNTSYIIRAVGQRGVRFSKAISFGNACDINDGELMEYFAQDPETDVIAAYIEGVRDGPRFRRAVMRAAAAKPVIVHKGGYTPAGAGAAASHTGSLAGSDRVWDELLEAAGAIRVHSLEDLVDMIVTFSLLRPPQGRRVALFGGGGGATVVATDDWDRSGFTLPPIPHAVRKDISGMVTSEAGLILTNPLDLSSFAYSDDFYGLVRRLCQDTAFADLSVIHIGFAQMAWFSETNYSLVVDGLREAAMRMYPEMDRPLALAVQYLVTTWDWQKALQDLQEPCSEVGIPVYYSMASAARAIDRFMRYREWRGVAGGES